VYVQIYHGLDQFAQGQQLHCVVWKAIVGNSSQLVALTALLLTLRAEDESCITRLKKWYNDNNILKVMKALLVHSFLTRKRCLLAQDNLFNLPEFLYKPNIHIVDILTRNRSTLKLNFETISMKLLSRNSPAKDGV
jgi:hypothetical protein